jgi:uncharacterized phage protein gp47/JayE
VTFGVTDEGFALKDFTSIVESTENEIKKNLGENIDLSDYSVIEQILKSFAYELAKLWQVQESVYYAGYPSTATGANLDAVVALLGITRLPATAATGSAIFSRSTAATYDITIPAGTIVMTAKSIQFATTAAVTLTAGQTSVSAAIEAVTPGASGNVAAYAITTIQSTISGIESVSNPSITLDGSDTETDTALRLRALNYSPGAKATLAAIQTALSAVTGVIACLVTEDTTAHTITATVLGGTDLALNAAIAASRPAGIACTLTRPASEIVVVTASVVMAAGGVEATVQANVLGALTAYFRTLTISSDVPYSSIVNAILGADGVASLASLSVVCGSTTLSAFGQTLTISPTQVAVEGTHVITVS